MFAPRTCKERSDGLASLPSVYARFTSVIYHPSFIIYHSSFIIKKSPSTPHRREMKKDFYYRIKLFFICSFLNGGSCEYLFDNVLIKLEFSFVCHKAVLLLLNVVELSVSKRRNLGVFTKHCGKTLESFKKFFLGLNAFTVSPSFAVFNPSDSAVLADKKSLGGVVNLALVVNGVSPGLILDNALVKLLEFRYSKV